MTPAHIPRPALTKKPGGSPFGLQWQKTLRLLEITSYTAQYFSDFSSIYDLHTSFRKKQLHIYNREVISVQMKVSITPYQYKIFLITRFPQKLFSIYFLYGKVPSTCQSRGAVAVHLTLNNFLREIWKSYKPVWWLKIKEKRLLQYCWKRQDKLTI